MDKFYALMYFTAVYELFLLNVMQLSYFILVEPQSFWNIEKCCSFSKKINMLMFEPAPYTHTQHFNILTFLNIKNDLEAAHVLLPRWRKVLKCILSHRSTTFYRLC